MRSSRRSSCASVVAPFVLWSTRLVFLITLLSCFVIFLADLAHAAVWYVNDNVTAGDSFTYAAGLDTQPGTAAAPFRAIGKAIKDSAMPGDTIFIDAGMYGETVVIDSLDAQITLIGVDSRVTIIDPPGPNTSAGVIAILVKNCTGVTIKNVGITGSFDGIVLDNADSAVIDNDSISRGGNFGIFVKSGSNFNQITNNLLFDFNNGGYTIQIDSGENTVSSNTIDSGAYGMLVSAESNVITSNTVKNHLNIGIYLNVAGAYGNRIETNTLTGNGTWGLYLAGPENRAYGNIIKQNTSGGVYVSAMSNFVRFNLIKSNTAVGMEIANNAVVVEQNDITGNDTGVFFNIATAGIVLRKNNIYSNNVNNVRNAYAASQTADRNWFGTADSAAIGAKLADANSDFDPWRLGKVDTAPGADTTAPAPPTGVVLDTSFAGRIKLTWINPVLNDETNGGALGFGGVKIYRLKNVSDTGHWANPANLVKTLTASDTTWTDTDVLGGNTFYYRLTSRDAAPFVNESFFTATVSALPDTPLFTQVQSTAGLSDAVDGNGCAWADYDGDTDLDIMVVNYGAADLLYRNDGNGSFTSNGVAAGVNGAGSGVGLSWGDYDNDGDIDLYVVNNASQNDYMYKNNGNSTFTNVATSVGMTESKSGDGASWGDYDNDGDLDLYVSNASLAQDFLYRNDGNGSFSRVDTQVGIVESITGYAVAWADYDKDGDLDLYVTHDGTNQDRLYQNNGHGQFTNVATAAGLTDTTYSNTAAWGDYDADGDLDLFVPDGSTTKNHMLYRNNGNGTFTNAIAGSGITDTGGGGVVWVDYDNDGDLDLFVSGSMVDGGNPNEALYRNNADGTFTQEAVQRGITVISTGYGGAWADYDNDGDMDLYITHQTGTKQDFLFKNKGTPGKNWIKVNPLTDKDGDAVETDQDTDRLALGALIEIDLDGGANFDTGFTKYVSMLLTGNGFQQTAGPVNLGVDTRATVDVRVTFPDGDTVVQAGVSTNQTITIRDPQFYPGPIWYVNDTVTTGDSFTYAAGSDVTGKGNAKKPFKTIARALAFAKAGDTIYIDAGTYAETVVIDADSISLIGKDSSATVIDPPSGIGIFADNQTGLLIKNLGVTGATDGIKWVNVDFSTINGDSLSSNTNDGIYLTGGCDTTTITSCATNFNSVHGIRIDTSAGNTVSGNTVKSNTNFALYLIGAANHTVSNNIVTSNSNYGIYLSSSSNNTVSGNTATSNGSSGIVVFANSNNNTITNNISNSNTNYGINLNSSNNNTITNNTTNSNTGPSGTGIVIDASADNLISSNTANSNTYWGIWLDASAVRNMVRNNLTRLNTSAGVRLAVSADSNTITQNDISGNDTGVHILNASRNNIITKNNIFNNNVKNLFNQGGTPQTLGRDWWGTTDSVTISGRIVDTASAWTPWRLGAVDTLAGADTTSPKAPDTVAVLGSPSDTSILLEWSASTTLEESNGGQVGLAGYRIYRSEVKDTSSWLKVGQTGSGAIRWQDTGVTLGGAYYYRVTAFDTASPFDNESFYSDSQPSDSAVFSSRINWYVNDPSTTADSYTYAAGSDTASGDGTTGKPLLSLSRAMQFVTTGDTIWIDAGTFTGTDTVVAYTETALVNITKDSLTLIGVDSNVTILDPTGPNSQTNLYGIYASGRTGLLIRKLGILGAYIGIRFNNVDWSTIAYDSVSSNANAGILLASGSDNNTLSDNLLYDNGAFGIDLQSSLNNTLTGNHTFSHGTSGVRTLTNSTNNTIQNHTMSGEYVGVILNSGPNLVANSVLTNALQYGIQINSNNNTIRNNVLSSNTRAGILLNAGDTTRIFQNDIANNDTGVHIQGSSKNNVITRNNLTGNDVNAIYNEGGMPQTITRNWFGSADSVTIKAKLTDTASAFSPYRIGPVDTLADADTTAPKAPDTIAIIGSPSDTSIILEWSAATALEEANGGVVGLSGYRIYRSETKDTSSWLKVGQTGSASIRWQDTTVAPGIRYYYRVTAFDTLTPFDNESFYSDSQPSDSAMLASQVNFYVNDASTAGDSFTYAAGADTAAGKGTVTAPFLTITRALLFATAGDSVIIDAGTYAETVVLYVDSVSLVGKDSNSTVIDPPGANTTAGLYGIYATGLRGLLIKNLAVTGAREGIRFDNVDLSTISGDSLCSNGDTGIYLLSGSETNTLTGNIASFNSKSGIYLVSGSNNNTLSNNTANSNTHHGIYLWSSANNNTLTGNTTNSNGRYGIYLSTNCNNNTISNNTSNSNTLDGLYLYSSCNNNLVSGNTTKSNSQHGLNLYTTSNGNVVRNNTSSSNTAVGIIIGNSSNNTFFQNDLELNGDYQVHFDPPSPSSDTFQKNNIRPSATNPDSGVYNGSNAATNKFNFTRNWWSSIDTGRIKKMIFQPSNGDSVIWQPFRLGKADTAVGADTTAPKSPDTVAVTASDTSVIVEWTAVTALEESNGGAVGLSGYRVYRSQTKDTSSWVKIGQQSGIRFQDTNLPPGQIHYYRVTAFDAAAYENESFFSDSQPGDSAPFTSTVNWYVNDASTAGDSYTYAAGNDLSGNGTVQNPFKSIPLALRLADAGDTIWIDAGLYDSYVTVNSTETAGVHADKNSITLIGKDSGATVIDPPGPKTQAGLYGIYADTQSGLLIKNLAVTGAYEGICWINVDQSTITADSVSSCGDKGIYLLNGSDTNTVSANTANSNFNGIYLSSSSGNTLNNNIANSNTAGIYLNSSSNNNTVSNNTANSNTDGFDVAASSNNTLSNNTANSNATYGFYLFSSSSNNTLTGNTANSNTSGIHVNSGSNNTFSNNITTSNSSRGIWLYTGTGNTVSGNTTSSNAYGVHLEGSSTGNTVSSNKSLSNTYGIRLETNADTNRVMNNLFNSNSLYGIHIVSSSNNEAAQNDVRNNTQYQIYIQGSSSRDTVQKNNLQTSATNPDSAVFNSSGNAFDLTRNFWTTADSAAINKKISDTNSPKLVKFQPYRLGAVDTVGGDSVAPKAPDTVAAKGGDTTINVTWQASSTNEEPAPGAVGVSGYRVYRGAVKDTSSWIQTAQVGSTVDGWQDTNVAPGQVYYYRVTAFDTNTPLGNESFFSDSQPADSASFTSTVGWYVNDGSTAGDSFTTAAGSDTGGDGTAQKPFKTITKALSVASPGDTVFVDAGLYAETVVLGADSISLVGKDSNATVIDPPGDSSTGGLYGIYATGRKGLLIKNLGVTGAQEAIYFNNVDLSTITGDSLTHNGDNGIYLYNGSDTNTITNNTASTNYTGIYVSTSCLSTTITGNTAGFNVLYGIGLNSAASNATIKTNTLTSNGSHGLYLYSGCNNNTIENNIVTSNLGHGVYLYSASNNNRVNDNVLRSNSAGFRVEQSHNNIVSQNDISANLNGVHVQDTATGNVIVKNNITGNTSNNVNNPSGLAQTLTRNWWGSTDESAISVKFNDTASAFRPYRFGAVDTAAGADTTAPAMPTGVTLDTATTAGAIKITWALPTINEETNGGAVGFNGVRIYRLRNAVDTTHWANPANLVHTGSSTETTWTDTQVDLAIPYYYRLTSLDTAALVNESFFTDTQKASPTLAANATGKWYVNDGSTAVDSFTYTVGSDTANNGTVNNPYRTITKALAGAKAGDTVYIDAGVYAETVVIETDAISLIGKDSNVTVIDPPGASTTSGLYGIYADTQTGLLIRNLGVMDANVGIKFVNVDQSTISGDSVTKFFIGGVLLFNGSDTNTVTNCEATTNSATTPSGGFYLDGSSGNTFSNNRSNSNPQQGFYIAGSRGNTFSGNTANSNTQNGFNLVTGSNNNTFSNNTVQSNSGNGFSVSSSSNLTVSNNQVLSNGSNGLALSSSSNNTFDRNTIHNNSLIGIDFSSNSDTNRFTQNSVRHNNTWGVAVGFSFGNSFFQNTLDSNVKEQVYLAGNSASNTFLKNNIRPSTQNPDSSVLNKANTADMTRNWWFTTDEDVIDRRISDTTGLTFRPYRLGIVDTTAGADTTAPAAPTGLTFDTTTVVGVIKLTWVNPTINEETNGGAVGFNGVRVYRLTNSVDTTHWANALVWTAAPTDTTWTDTQVATGNTYYYRLTSRDTQTLVNESFFSDTKFTMPMAPSLTLDTPNGGEIWTVGDTRTVGWSTVGTISNVKLEYSTDSGGSFPNLITPSAANTGSYAWNVPDSIGKNVRVRVSNAVDAAISDLSNANFEIRGSLTLTQPNGGDSLQAGMTTTIAWTTVGTIPSVKLEYSTDSGSSWTSITNSTGNIGSYGWSVPNFNTTQAKVRVSNATDTATNDTSNDVFRIWPIVLPPPPDTIQLISGNQQLGRISMACAKPIKVRVLDTGGVDGVKGAKVTFTVTFGSGALLGSVPGPTIAYTDSQGYVTETLVLGATAGVYRVEARNDSVTPAKSVLFTSYADGREVPAGGSTLGAGWRMVGPNKSAAGWNLKSSSGGLPNATVYEWQAGAGNNSSLNNTKYYAPSGDAVRGRAYWLKDATGGRVFVPSEGVASDTFETVSVRLSAGWNQISSGQYFYVSWDSGVAFDSSNLTDTPLPQNQRLTPIKADDTDQARRVIQNKVYWYTGSNYIYGPAAETSSLTTLQLKPMVGFWLYAEKACTMYIYPNPASPETAASEILNQAPSYLSANFTNPNPTAGEADWGIQILATSAGVTDWQNYVGVKPTDGLRQTQSALEAPGLAAGFLTLAVRPASSSLKNSQSAIPNPQSQPWMSASYAAPSSTGQAWDVSVATDLSNVTTLTWDNVSNLPATYEAYLIGAPTGSVNLRRSASLPLSLSPSLPLSLTLVIGLPEYVAPFLAAPLSKDESFVYPNPGPDAAGQMTFKYNLQAVGEVSLKIFDIGGKLIKELKETGAAGSNTTLKWDGTNKGGQKVGSGVYIYILESGGTKLVDKLAIVR